MTAPRMHRLAVVAALALLTACETISLVGPERRPIGDWYSVEPQVRWSRVARPGRQTWTVDGFALQSLQFFDAVDDGESLLESGDGKPVPTFRRDMTPTEVEELVVDTLARSGAAEVRASNLRPARFGSADGFRFFLSYLTRSGLEADGMALGTIHDGRLYLVLYTGARQHYFPAYRPAVERLFESVRTGR